MKPSEKSPAIEHFIRQVFGFDRISAIEDQVCPICGKKVAIDDFKDELSLKEFTISGMCQQCQNGVFE